jgi:L-lactate dehydrogenase (cytochrome)
MRALARRALPRPVFDFADGGAETEWTLRRNEGAFRTQGAGAAPARRRRAARPVDVLFGQRLSMPLMIGPTGLAGLFWPDGERAAARAAAAAGTAYCLSHGSVCTLESARRARHRTALDAGLRLPRPRLHPGVHRPRGGRRLRRAGADHRQPAARQPRARRAQRLRHPAATSVPGSGWHAAAAAVALADARCAAHADLRQLRARRIVRGRSRRSPGAMGSLLDPGWLGRRARAARALDGPLLLKGVLHPRKRCRRSRSASTA